MKKTRFWSVFIFTKKHVFASLRKWKKHVFEAFFMFKKMKKHVFEAFSYLQNKHTFFKIFFFFLSCLKNQKHVFEAFSSSQH